jgi:tight adherence protein B
LDPIFFIFLVTALLVVVAGGVAIFGLINAVAGRDDLGDRISTYASVPDVQQPKGSRLQRAQLVRWRLRLNRMLSSLANENLGLQLISANWAITESEFLLIRILGTVAGFLLGWLVFRNPIPGIGIAAILYVIPGIVLAGAIQKRRTAFEKQLVDVLVLITSAVRAGYSLLQSMDVVVQEMNAPASEEFRRVRREVGLGLPMSQALENLTERMQNDDLYLVVTAININSQVGGNLTTMLEAVTSTIRERVRLFSEVRALTSQQRYSAYLLTMLPFIFGGVLFVINPEYIKRLFEPGIWLCFPIGAVVFVLIGNLLIMRMTKIKV